LLFSVSRHPLQHTSSLVNLQPVLSHHTMAVEASNEVKSERIASH
jgi:hypothetical protein